MRGEKGGKKFVGKKANAKKNTSSSIDYRKGTQNYNPFCLSS